MLTKQELINLSRKAARSIIDNMSRDEELTYFNIVKITNEIMTILRERYELNKNNTKNDNT